MRSRRRRNSCGSSAAATRMAFSSTSQMPAPAPRKKSRHRSSPSAMAAAAGMAIGIVGDAGVRYSLPLAATGQAADALESRRSGRIASLPEQPDYRIRKANGDVKTESPDPVPVYATNEEREPMLLPRPNSSRPSWARTTQPSSSICPTVPPPNRQRWLSQCTSISISPCMMR
ncbi:uncharacterized protein [Lolium perenne]|uniref:uncharacterized protein n=1 Tax=Lolium perenne TaxID=4522 RepID=UPI0021F65A4D|nr:uncharacterized protein LOC127292919 [Lolium perenne]XP_051178414.1 uncharacterized protein LOC127292919 [Lolium perenne]